MGGVSPNVVNKQLTLASGRMISVQELQNPPEAEAPRRPESTHAISARAGRSFRHWTSAVRCGIRHAGAACTRSAAPGRNSGGPARQAKGPSSPRRSWGPRLNARQARSEEHTSELQSRENLVCRLLLEKKKKMLFWLVLTL